MNEYNIGYSLLALAGMNAVAMYLLVGVHSVDQTVGKRATWTVGGTLTVWHAVALGLGVTGFFRGAAGEAFPRVALMAVPLVAAWLVATVVPSVSAVARQISPSRLIGIQAFRIEGAIFLVGYAAGILPGEFALPAGLGDVAIGLAAPFVARSLAQGDAGSQTRARVWNTFGILDLVVAVSMGVMTSPGALHKLALSNPNVGITQFPFVIVPTVLVPLALVLHGLTSRALAREATPLRSASAAIAGR